MPLGIDLFVENIADQDKANAVIGRLFEVAQPEKAFSVAATSHDFTVITASEVSVSMGLAYGGGGGSDTITNSKDDVTGSGFGGGGGGGGVAKARPIAAIEISPNGVKVEPIVDITTLALAFFTMLGTMMMLFSKMKKNT